MNKIYLLVVLLLSFSGTVSAYETNKTVIVTNNESGEYVTIEDGEVMTYSYAYADSDSGQDKSKKRKGKSVSTSTSTSTSNGKSVTSVATSRSGDQQSAKSVEHLHVYPLFGDKYKRHPDCVLTVIENQYSKFRELKVNNNPGLVRDIRSLVEQDAALSPNVVRTYNQDSDQIIMNGEYGSVGYTEYLDNASCSIFISWI